MTSPQAAALDVAPEIATTAINILPSVTATPNHEVDLTAEAQAEPVDEAANSNAEQNQANEVIHEPATQLLGISGGGLVEENGGYIRQQPGEFPSGAGDASIPNSDHLQTSYPTLTNEELVRLGTSMAHVSDISVLATFSQIRDCVFQDSPLDMHAAFSSAEMNQLTADAFANSQQPYSDLDPEPVSDRQVEAYAKLEFPDGAYYMNTYGIYLGRDQVAARKVLKRDQEREKRLLAGTPRQEDLHAVQPVASNSGGILVPENDPPEGAEEPESRKGRSKKSKASKNSKSSHSSKSRRNSLPYMPGVYPAQRTGSDTEAVPVDPLSLRPPADNTPLIGIHPINQSFKAYKAISRRHVCIKFNSDICIFELHVLGRNGCFLNEELRPPGTTHPLESGSVIQIGEVCFTFILPGSNVPDVSGYGDDSGRLKDTYYMNEDDQENYFDNPVFRDARGKEMNTDHSQEIRKGAGEFSDEESSDDEDVSNDQEQVSGISNGHIRVGNADEDEDEEAESDNEDDAEEGDDEDDELEEEEEDAQAELPRQSIEEDESPTASAKGTKPPGKKGPGRPPKNGVMSKRAEKELRKQQEEAAAAAEKTGAETSEAPKKGKVGRPRKHPLPDPDIASKPKRKYTKRKPKENQEGNGEGPASGGDGNATTTKVKKEKPFKPPRSPTPVYNEDELTPEQLAKPSENYVVIIHTAMSQSKHKEMGLPQIYNAIKRTYPFFATRAETKGWESSVRHNLSGNPDVFEKGAKDGKGHMWSLKPGASVDKDKKRKTQAESQFQGQPQVIQQAPQNMHQHAGVPYGYPNYPAHPNANYPLGPPPPFMPHQSPPYPPQQNGFSAPPPNWQHGYPIPTIIPPALAPTVPSGSYSSPYGNGPPAESNGPQPSNQPHPPSGSLPQTPNQNPPQQVSPPAAALHQPQPQYQNAYPPPNTAPHTNYAPTPLPHQNPPPSNLQQLSQFQPHPAQNPAPITPQDRSQPSPQTQSVPQVPQNKSSSPPQNLPQNLPPTEPQNISQQLPQPPLTQQPAPPQQPSPSQVNTPSVPAPASDVETKVNNMLGEFKRILKASNIAKEDSIDAAIALVKRDGNNAVPDENSPDPGSVRLIINTLRGALTSIEGSGFTSPDYQRSFQPTRTSSEAPSQLSASVNGANSSGTRLPSTIPRPPFSAPGISRPPMHTGIRRTDSSSPAGSIRRPASVDYGPSFSVSGSPAPAAAATPVPVQGANGESPNGASAAMSTPVSGLEALLETQAAVVPKPIERPADVDVTVNVSENDKGINVNGQSQQIVGQKRSRDEVDGLVAEGQENAKRVAV